MEASLPIQLPLALLTSSRQILPRKGWHLVRVDELPEDLPLFLARAGQDEMPGLNETIDRFMDSALIHNLPVTLVNHPSAPHAFDLLDDSETSREMIRQILTFLRFHLLLSDASA